MTSDQIVLSFGLLVSLVAVGGVFAFVSVLVYSENRRKEREAFYRAEVHKRVLEQPGGGADQLRSLMLVEEAARARQTRDSIFTWGLVTTAVGIAMLILQRGGGAWTLWKIGYVPLSAGIAMIVFVGLTSFRTKPQAREGRPGTPDDTAGSKATP